MKHFIYWTADVKSSELWYSQLLKQFMQLYIKKPETSQDFNRFWTRDLVILVRCSNQLSYDATDIGSWSFVAPKEPVRNDCSRHIWNISYIELQMWNQISYATSFPGSSPSRSLERERERPWKTLVTCLLAKKIPQWGSLFLEGLSTQILVNIIWYWDPPCFIAVFTSRSLTAATGI